MAMIKFPVTAPDGTQFRIKFRETHYFIGRGLEISLYVRRKLAGFRLIYRHEKFDIDRNNLDYVALAHWAVNDYYEALEEYSESKLRKAEAKSRGQAAKAAFEQWDGKITKEVSAE
jgi:dsDNA-specific endonuclease/ATPase MutS2